MFSACRVRSLMSCRRFVIALDTFCNGSKSACPSSVCFSNSCRVKRGKRLAIAALRSTMRTDTAVAYSEQEWIFTYPLQRRDEIAVEVEQPALRQPKALL